jgi:FAD/FMN-containing dehydrogenase
LLRKRSVLLTLVLVATSFLIVTFREIFIYSAGPDKEKESNFIYPRNADQEKPTSLLWTGAAAAKQEPDLSLAQTGGFTNDASHLNRTAIHGIVRIKTEEDIRNALIYARAKNLKVTCAGQQHSMGGQSFAHGGLVLDLQDFNHFTVDKEHRLANVQGGVRWWQLQQALDKQGLSVKAMQSINIFSVGGTLSVNAHGIDPDPGPIAPTVRGLRVMLGNGEIVKASTDENSELFRHVLGGYGLFGIILDADLELADNALYVRKAVYMDYEDFPRYYQKEIEQNQNIGLAFGRLSVAPKGYLKETVAHIYEKTPFAGSLPELKPARHDAVARFVINLSKTGGFGRWVRWTLEKYVEPQLHDCVSRNEAMSRPGECLVSRNEEMYDNMTYLKNRLRDTDILQEYFIPCDNMPQFADRLREIVKRDKANLLNVTIRTVHRDSITALPYAKQNMFGFVLYFNCRFNDREAEVLRKTTVDLIDAAHQSGGTFYLPYQLFYSKAQLRSAYPEIDNFFAAKRKYDPTEMFSNKFYEKYGM